jgi:hypothetical protein
MTARKQNPTRSASYQHTLRNKSMQSEAACVPDFCAASLASTASMSSSSGSGSALQFSLSELLRSKSIRCDSIVIVVDNAKLPTDALIDAALEELSLVSGESSSDCSTVDSFVEESNDFDCSVWELDALNGSSRWCEEKKRVSCPANLNRSAAPIKPAHDPSTPSSQRRRSTSDVLVSKPNGIKQLQEQYYATTSNTRRSVGSTTLLHAMPSFLRQLPPAYTANTSSAPRTTGSRRALISDILEESIAITKSSFQSNNNNISISGSTSSSPSLSHKSPSKQTRQVDSNRLRSNCRKMNVVF